MATVKVIKAEGQSSVVEYRQGNIPYRVVVPTDAISEGEVEDEFLAISPAYGVDFNSIASATLKKYFSYGDMSDYVSAELANAGIWTLEDLQDKRREARMLLNSLFGSFFARFLAAVVENENNERT